MRSAGRPFRIEDLVPVPNLNLRRASQIDPTVCLGNRFVFKVKFDIAKLFVSIGVRAVTVVDQFAILDGPVRRKLGALLSEVLCLFFFREAGGCVRI